MTKERFMELAAQHEVSVEHAEGLWRVRPSDVDDMPESQIETMLEVAKDPIAQALAVAMVKCVETVFAHEKARMN